MDLGLIWVALVADPDLDGFPPALDAFRNEHFAFQDFLGRHRGMVQILVALAGRGLRPFRHCRSSLRHFLGGLALAFGVVARAFEGRALLRDRLGRIAGGGLPGRFRSAAAGTGGETERQGKNSQRQNSAGNPALMIDKPAHGMNTPENEVGRGRGTPSVFGIQ